MYHQKRFDKVKSVVYRECTDLSESEKRLLEDFFNTFQERMVDKPVETTNEQAVVITMSNEEAKKILHCLARTSARNTYRTLVNILDTCESIEQDIIKQLG